MTPSTSVHAFEEFFEGRGGALPGLTVRTGVAEMLAFYEAALPVGCASENGEMLLFQWGTYDWGDGKHFEIYMTRQFIEAAAEDDDAISQLQLVFRFAPDKDRYSIGAGNRWCSSQSDIDTFRAEADSNPPSVSLHHEYV
jgi:hypothetical protein